MSATGPKPLKSGYDVMVACQLPKLEATGQNQDLTCKPRQNSLNEINAMRTQCKPDFRAAGMTDDAIGYPRSTPALIALKRFNGLPDDAPVPAAWSYFPNAWMRDNWQRLYGHLVRDLHTDCCTALALAVLGQDAMAREAADLCEAGR